MIYQASDLNQRGRNILDAARSGEARLRDKDGFSLVMVPEARLAALTAVARAAASLAALEHALAAQSSLPLDLASYGDWPWLRVFDAEDLQEFIRELREAVIVAGREEATGLLDETLYRWRVTAEALEDPLRRSVLLGTPGAEDFVEVSRPE
jgi:hypothetical protein